jgi:hypothetical protein
MDETILVGLRYYEYSSDVATLQLKVHEIFDTNPQFRCYILVQFLNFSDSTTPQSL